MAFMADQVHRFTVLVASPGDTRDLRGAIRDAIDYWNAIGRRGGVVLQAVGWEQDAPALYGARAQDTVNEAIVDDVDFAIAVFRARLGTPTGEAPSGTVEEMLRLAESGRRVLVYRARNVTLDPTDAAALEELGRLASFLKEIQPMALIKEFDGPGDLIKMLTPDIGYVVNQLTSAATQPVAPPVIDTTADAVTATLLPSSRRYSYELEVRNEGPSDLLDLVISTQRSDGLRALSTPLIPGGSAPATLAAGARSTYPVAWLPGMANHMTVALEWSTETDYGRRLTLRTTLHRPT